MLLRRKFFSQVENGTLAAFMVSGQFLVRRPWIRSETRVTPGTNLIAADFMTAVSGHKRHDKGIGKIKTRRGLKITKFYVGSYLLSS